MLNKQPIEKRDFSADGSLDVHSIFRTIQGEGPFCGTPAVFVRLAGCNLQCPWCDTEYTAGRKRMNASLIVLQVAELQSGGLVVITGGEPFRQDLRELLRALEMAGYYVQIETNGTLAPTEYKYRLNYAQRMGVYIVCSPKTGRVHPYIFDNACCLKYVVEDGDVREEDGLPLHALGHTANPYVARPPALWERPIYVQPMDSKDVEQNARNMQTAVASCLKFNYILQLQVHKYLGLD